MKKPFKKIYGKYHKISKIKRDRLYRGEGRSQSSLDSMLDISIRENDPLGLNI